MQLIINKLRANRYYKYFVIFSSTFLLYLIYCFYLWCNTQSSDNAYLESDISNISAEVNGVITKVLVPENTHVKIGDVIAEIDNSEYKSKLTAALAEEEVAKKTIEIIKQQILIEKINLEKAKDKLQLAKISLDIAKTDYKRTYELCKDNFASKKLLDSSSITLAKANSEYNQATLAVETAEQMLELFDLMKNTASTKLISAVEMREIAERNFNKTQIIAQTNGILSNTALRVGNYVRIGAPLFSIVPSDGLYVRVNFKETQVAKLKTGMEASIVFDALPKMKFLGKIRNISAATGSRFSLFPADNATGNFTKIVQRISVLIDLPNIGLDEQKKLASGMSALVQIRTD